MSDSGATIVWNCEYKVEGLITLKLLNCPEVLKGKNAGLVAALGKAFQLRQIGSVSSFESVYLRIHGTPLN